MTRKEKLILLVKFVLTEVFLFLHCLEVLCNPIESPTQVIAMQTMVWVSIVAFFVYWALWLFWDEKRLAKNQIPHRILFYFAAGLCLARFLYSFTLCPTPEELKEHLGTTAPKETITDLSDIEF